MIESLTYNVFLGHSSIDKDLVRPIAERLRNHGLRIWFDEWVLKPVDSTPTKIEKGLERSRVLVLCLSASAVGYDWAQLVGGSFRFRDPLNQEHRFVSAPQPSAFILQPFLDAPSLAHWRTSVLQITAGAD